MSEADKYPDYDLSFLEGTTGDDLSALSRNIDDSAKQLGRKIDEIPEAARTETTERVYEDLVALRQGLEKAATDVAKTASAFNKMKAAWGVDCLAYLPSWRSRGVSAVSRAGWLLAAMCASFTTG